MIGQHSFNILFPSIVDPALHHGGAGTVTRAFLRLLQRAPLSAQIECVVPTYTRRRSHRGRQLTSLARTLVSPLPSKALFTYSRRFRNDVQRMLRTRGFDLILLNGSDLLWLLPQLPRGLPVILMAHNIEHQLFLSQINSLHPSSRLLRGALMRDMRRLVDYEMSGLRRVENIVFLSRRDAEFAVGENPNINAIIVPPIFDDQSSDIRCFRHSPDGMHLGFVGNFGWWPNREGLRWFLKEVFPHTGDNTRLHLFGEQSQSAPRHARIVNHGFVPRTQDIWPICDFMICPAICGGGVNVKLAEAVYNRMPVLATSFGATGLPLESDPGIVVLDRAEEWVSFLRSPAACALRSRRLPASVADAFAMASHVERAHSFIQDVIQRHTAH